MPPTTHKFKIENRELRITLITTESDLDIALSDIITTIANDRKIKRVVGLDIEKSYYSPLLPPSPPSDKTALASQAEILAEAAASPGPKIAGKVSVIKLCVGRSCLLVQILHFHTVPATLARFLELPDLSFVGVGIKHTVEALQRDYGLMVRKSVDLGDLAGMIRGKPYLAVCGLADLAKEAGLMNLSAKVPSAAFGDWGMRELSSAQIRAAGIDAFASFHIGNLLLGGITM